MKFKLIKLKKKLKDLWWVWINNVKIIIKLNKINNKLNHLSKLTLTGHTTTFNAVMKNSCEGECVGKNKNHAKQFPHQTNKSNGTHNITSISLLVPHPLNTPTPLSIAVSRAIFSIIKLNGVWRIALPGCKRKMKGPIVRHSGRSFPVAVDKHSPCFLSLPFPFFDSNLFFSLENLCFLQFPSLLN